MKARTNGIETNYVIEGEGPWLTMSHSLACNLSMWDDQAQRLSKHFKVLRYDTRGHGGSSAPDGAYTLEQMADDVKALFDHLGVKRTHWVGLSMGGMIGQAFELKYPGIFERMVLADTTSRRPPNANQMWGDRRKIVQEQGMEGVVQSTLERWFTEPYRSSRKDVMDRIARDIRSTPVKGFVGATQAIENVDYLDRLKEIRIPTLVIVGDQDHGTPPEMAKQIADNLPGSKLVIIPNAAHLSNIEQAEAFNKALFDFLGMPNA